MATVVAFAWGVESRLAVRVGYAPSPVRLDDPHALIIFSASESGAFEARVGPGCDGPLLEAGQYGPGWNENTDREERAVSLVGSGLPAGEVVVSVCVRSGIAFGHDEARFVVEGP
jgi:hypothetical protein